MPWLHEIIEMWKVYMWNNIISAFVDISLK